MNSPELSGTNSGGENQGSTSQSHTNSEQDEGTSNHATHTRKWDRDHRTENIIGNPNSRVRTKSATMNECLYACFLSQNEPKNIEEALLDPDWIVVMQEELNQFERSKV